MESLHFEFRCEILKNVDFLLWAYFLWSIWTRSKIDVIRGCIFLNTLPLAVYLHISMVLNILPLAVSCQYSWMRSDKFMSTFFHCNKSYHLLSIVNAHWWKVPYYCVPNISTKMLSAIKLCWALLSEAGCCRVRFWALLGAAGYGSSARAEIIFCIHF